MRDHTSHCKSHFLLTHAAEATPTTANQHTRALRMWAYCTSSVYQHCLFLAHTHHPSSVCMCTQVYTYICTCMYVMYDIYIHAQSCELRTIVYTYIHTYMYLLSSVNTDLMVYDLCHLPRTWKAPAITWGVRAHMITDGRAHAWVYMHTCTHTHARAQHIFKYQAGYS